MGLFGKSEPQKLNVVTGPRGVPARNESPSVAPQTLIGDENDHQRRVECQ